jgi:hypothetical protein
VQKERPKNGEESGGLSGRALDWGWLFACAQELKEI